ncbi:MAG: hypothetical protein NTW01_01050 [Gammaproteobacteria bacterium]|nr:hypothetical protein [Gammaproteobacteria bacterium]
MKIRHNPLVSASSQSGAQYIEPPAPKGDLDSRLAFFIFMHRVADPDPIRRRWYTALCNNVHRWTEPREYRPSESPVRDCIAFVREHGGTYYEGLIVRPGKEQTPSVAVWARLTDRIVCFTHDLTSLHGMVGIPFSDDALTELHDLVEFPGPFLFHQDPYVLERAVPKSMYRSHNVPFRLQ